MMKKLLLTTLAMLVGFIALNWVGRWGRGHGG